MTSSDMPMPTEVFAKQPEPSTSTPSPGSTSEDGKQTGLNNLGPLLERLRLAIETEEAVMVKALMPEPVQALISRPKTSSAVTYQAMPKLLKDSPTKMIRVIEILRQCWKTLKLYGSKESNFEERSDVFIALLGDYPAEGVLEAFRKYIQTRSEFPVPADIIGIIEGRVSRDQSVYRQLLAQRREGVFLTDEEKDYIRKYEQQTMGDWE